MATMRSSMLGVFLVTLLVFQTGCKKPGEDKHRLHETGTVKRGDWMSPATTCSLPAQGNCNPNNTCPPGGVCAISATINGSSVSLTMTVTGNPTPQDASLLCVAQGGQMQWSAATPNSNLLLDFGNAPPFANTYLTSFTGDNYTNGQNNPVSQAAASVNACYKYNVKVCPNTAPAANGTLPCGEVDPKVIIGSGS